MSEYIPRRLRELVKERAKRRCEYCLCPFDISTENFAVDHIVPRVRGGHTTQENLAFACTGCNGKKYDKTEGFNPLEEETAPLYNPRKHNWSDHFMWRKGYTELTGITPTGRASIATLQLNRTAVVNLRRVLFLAGVHPPEDVITEPMVL